MDEKIDQTSRGELLVGDREEKPVEERVSASLHHVLSLLWKEHFNKNGSFSFEDGSRTRQFTPYQNQVGQLMIVLENLHKKGLIKTSNLFTNAGYFRENATDDEVAQLFTDEKHKGILDGVSIAVIGGPEARIFAAMGATAAGFDKTLGNAAIPPPSSDLTTLSEVPEYVTEKLSTKYEGQFDVTYSSWLFDRGSGLDIFQRNLFGPIEQDEPQIYSYYISCVLRMTKQGGISIHNGNMLSRALQLKDTIPYRLVARVAHFANTKPDDSANTFVLQRK